MNFNLDCTEAPDTTTEKVYVTSGPCTAEEIMEKASELWEKEIKESPVMCNFETASKYVMAKNYKRTREVFSVLFLTTKHSLIAYEELFFGTIDSSAVYPREVVKRALELNAKAVILCHNHPSGNSEPSESDKRITGRIKEALSTVDINVLDHLIVGSEVFSFAKNNLI